MSWVRYLAGEFWITVGVRRRTVGWLDHVITTLAAAVAIYVIVAATAVIMAPWSLVAIFLCATMGIAFLSVGATPNSDPERPSVIDYGLSLASFATGIHFTINAQDIVNRIALLSPLSEWDLLFGALMILLTLEITRRTTGMGLTVLVIIFILYNFLGHRLDGVLKHGYIDYVHFIDIVVYTTDGIMGLPARVAATYAFLFVLFGTVLYYAKGSDFFYDIAAVISGRRMGGPAKIAVISSGMFGMISGSPTSDVVATGSITIPVMKRLGYQPAVAGAIEVAASTGGSIMPPVMGSAAFIMAEFTGIEYRDIAIAALLPALLYYLGCYAQVHFRAVRFGLGGLDGSAIPKLWPTLQNGGLFLVPLVVLTVALLYGYTPTMVAVFGALSVVVTAALKRETRLSLAAIWKSIAETTLRMVPVVGACAAAGLVIAGVTMTGLAAKFAHVVYAITDAEKFTTLLIAAALCTVLGMGMPTPSAYVLAAVLVGPILTQVGMTLLSGHMFLLYFAVMSAITPPVAVAAYAASSIAEENPIKIAGHAVKLALAAFMVPFIFAYGPELLLEGPWWRTAITFGTAAVALVLFSAAVENYTTWCPTWWLRLSLLAGAIMLFTPFFLVETVGGAICAVVILLGRSMARRRGILAPAASPAQGS